MFRYSIKSRNKFNNQQEKYLNKLVTVDYYKSTTET